MTNRTYRNRVNGLVGEFPENLAETYRDLLVEVEPGSKPLAYTRISEPASAEVSDPTTEPHGDPAAAPAPDGGSVPSKKTGTSA